MTVSMPIGKLLRREGIHLHYLPGSEKSPYSNPAGIAVKQFSYEPDVAIVVEEGTQVDHAQVRRTLDAGGFRVWVEDEKVLIEAEARNQNSIKPQARMWSE